MHHLSPYILGFLIAGIVIVISHLAEKYLIRQPFWRKNTMFPADHATASDGVFMFIDLIANQHDLTDEAITSALVEQGISKLDAELIVRFVPMAFAWTILRKLGVSSFPSSFIVFDRQNRAIELPLAREHYFAAALGIADEVAHKGFSDRITRPTFEAIVARSAEMDSANKMLAAGKEVAGSKILPPGLLGIFAEDFDAARRRA